MNCDGSGPHTAGKVRLLPTGGGGNIILCRACYDHEIAYRKERNLEVAHAFETPKWETLKVYNTHD